MISKDETNISELIIVLLYQKNSDVLYEIRWRSS